LAALTDNQTEIMAMDLYPQRLDLLRGSAVRLGCSSITTQAWDMTQPCTLLAGQTFDRVLVDAPCSGLGVLRRNPESRWRRTEADILRLAKLQGEILTNAAELVSAGGMLLYSLCTTTAEESREVIERFLDHNSDFVQQDLHTHAPEHWRELFDDQGRLMTLTTRHDGMDCFFATALRRN
jgi:16S rRNA (cytosine967-C5)-methyltransferase